MFGRGWVGVGLLVYDLPLSKFVASGRVVSIMCFGCYVSILGLGMRLRCCECLSHLVVFVLLILLRGICVDCIWGGGGVG